jgi:L-alanine-DL-glutamate epimerase-like enolase superfamily enzyme
MFASVEVIPYALPFRRTYRTSTGEIDQREMVLLRLTATDGFVGLGEAVPLSLRGGAALATVVKDLRDWAAATETGREEPTDPMTAPARCAIETAIADIAARREGLPLHAFLGQPEARPIKCNATIGADDPAVAASDAANWAADGFSSFKLKAGTGDEDILRVAATREAVGSRARVRIDANGAWSVEQASEMLARLAEFDLELVEQPVSSLDAMAELKAKLGIPVIADESVSNAFEAEQAASIGACDGATVKLSKIGTLDPSLGGHLPVYLSSALDGPVGIAAAAHVAQTLPEDGPLANLAQGLATARLFGATIASSEAQLDGDLLRVPSGHGLGIEIDEKALERFRL